MEGSKAFSKDFMARHNIPTAAFKTCGHRVVLKASGLAGGKGVLIPETTEEAIAGLNEIMVANVFGDAGPSDLLAI
jgi:phosphoribosylamine--glycine ligase/phosphoribosylformylglycinamidine cyclo-ligase